MSRKRYNYGKGEIVAWLRERVSHTGLNCLEFPFTRNGWTGYGQFGHEGKVIYAHRFMCELKNGPAPSDRHHAAHTCGNGHMGCVNPMHLAWKTVAENSADRTAMGNQRQKGCKRIKLRPEQVVEILALKGKKSQMDIAKEYSISRETISSIHTGRGWPQIARS